MMLALLIASLVQAEAPAEPPEIVVTGKARGKCRVELADRTLSTGALAARARGWAASGTPVRVVRPRGADYRCLAKVAFSLNRHGVTLIQFVERGPPDSPAPAGRAETADTP